MEILKLPATMTKYQSMSNRSMRLQITSQENLTDEQISKITAFHEKFVWLCLFHEKSKESDMLEAVKDMPPLVKEEFEKSPSQVLRGRIFLLWKKQGEQGEFDIYYRKYINAIVSKIDSLLQ